MVQRIHKINMKIKDSVKVFLFLYFCSCDVIIKYTFKNESCYTYANGYFMKLGITVTFGHNNTTMTYST